MYSTGPWSGNPKDPKVQELADKFYKRFGHYPKEHEAEGYSAVYVMADALRRAKSFARSDIHDALLSTDLPTVFGPVKFETFEGYTNQNSGLKNGQVVLSQWQNRRLYNVWPADVSEAKPTYPGTYK